jgi:hypothetical protein
MRRVIAYAVLIVLAIIGSMHYEHYRSEQSAFDAMGEAQMLREQLREPEQSK